MTGTSLLFITMPIVVPIFLAVLIALPFLAARNPGRGIASGVPAGAEGSAHHDSGGTAANQRPPEDQASPHAA
jgi:hypothetical protein